MSFRAMYSCIELARERKHRRLDRYIHPSENVELLLATGSLQESSMFFIINVSIYRFSSPNTIPRDATPYNYVVPGLRCPGLNKVGNPSFVSFAPDMNLLVIYNQYFALMIREVI